MGLKRTLRRSLDRAARAAGVLHLAERGMARGLTILMYHRVLPEERVAAYPFPALAVPRAAFEAQMRHLAATCTVLPVVAALAAQARGAAVARPLVAITFDDGYGDNARIAAPILEACGVRGTFFVATDFVSGRAPLWYDRAAAAWSRASAEQRGEVGRAALEEGAGTDVPVTPAPDTGTPEAFVEHLKRLSMPTRLALIDRLDGGRMDAAIRGESAPMSPSDLLDLVRVGHEIGSHSIHHEILPQLDDAALAVEIGASRAEIEAWIGTAPHGFCYPNGDHDARVVAAVRAAGHSYACTTLSGRNAPGHDPHRLRRVDVTARRVCRDDLSHDADAFRAEVSGLHDLLRGGVAP